MLPQYFAGIHTSYFNNHFIDLPKQIINLSEYVYGGFGTWYTVFFSTLMLRNFYLVSSTYKEIGLLHRAKNRKESSEICDYIHLPLQVRNVLGEDLFFVFVTY